MRLLASLLPSLAGTVTAHAGLIAALPAGAYGVAWRALSSDGHAVQGHFVFVIGDGAD